MGYDRKGEQGRRMELLEYHPVRDHVLDIVRHECGAGGEEKNPKIPVGERSKCAALGGLRWHVSC
jgi:hypothetical protein